MPSIAWPKRLKALLVACKHRLPISQIHALILTTGLSHNSNSICPLITSYSSLDDLISARKLFDKLPHRVVNVWNSMIVVYSHRNYPNEVLNLFFEMRLEGVKPDSSTFTVALKACSVLMELEIGEQIWRQAVDFGYGYDVFVGSSVLNLYASCGKMDEAKFVFDRMVKKDVVICTTMIKGFVQSGRALEAIDVYRRMRDERIEGDEVSLVSLVQACGSIGDSKLGLSVHGYVIRKEMPVNNVLFQTSLVNMYAKNGNVELAFRVFEEMPYKSVVSWGALISGFAQNGFAGNALAVLVEMQKFGFRPDSASIISSLLACSQLGYLKLGKSLHGFIVRRLQFEEVLGTALIDMYAKCGATPFARALFDKIESKDLILWNAMIGSYGIDGHGKEALSLFLKMRDTNISPDHVTFSTLLSALSHSGLVEEGQCCYRVMVSEYKIEPHEKHYACMVDLLSRAGRVEEAYQLIESMHIEPGLAIWVALLSGCHNCRKLSIGEMAAKRILESNPDDFGIYVLVSNFFSMAGKWDEVAILRKIMKNTGMRKVPGYSAVEVDGKHQAFLMEDKNHHRYEDILQILDILDTEMRAIRHIPETEFGFVISKN
ncbi:Tetratricopeptide repeat (TPR)-like superfamily protein [Euphorbia peplus]|nr:Tetratricopeptide repeat (TPR)-like superfamily protein [Euphorbia peplus]